MNLIEARKLAHEGWVRSPSMTDGEYGQIDWCPERGLTMRHPPCYIEVLTIEDLDAEDWEPKLVPAKPFEAEVWVPLDGSALSYKDMNAQGWRKIRVREVLE